MQSNTPHKPIEVEDPIEAIVQWGRTSPDWSVWHVNVEWLATLVH